VSDGGPAGDGHEESCPEEESKVSSFGGSVETVGSATIATSYKSRGAHGNDDGIAVQVLQPRVFHEGQSS
jgi:hypothetical protein